MLLQLRDQFASDLIFHIAFDQREVVCEQTGRHFDETARPRLSPQLGDHFVEGVESLFDVIGRNGFRFVFPNRRVHLSEWWNNLGESDSAV